MCKLINTKQHTILC